MLKTKNSQILFLLLLSGALFFANTWGYDLWPPDEPRFGQVAREMMQTGDYLSPHINGLPYKEKPPLLFWAISAISMPFGDVNEFTARAPSGIAGVITVLLTYLLAARLYDRRTALWAGLILATTALFWSEARSSRCDMLLTAAMTGALYSFWRWNDARKARWLVALYAAITVGLFAKGPPALIFPVMLFIFFYRNVGRTVSPPESTRGLTVRATAGLLVPIALVLCWFIPARLALPKVALSSSAPTGMGSELIWQTLGRFIFGGSKAAWPWMYIQDLPLDLLPWTLFLPWTLIWVWKRRREDARMRLLLAWSVPALIFFSICIGKRDIYLLPIYPALAILFARSVLDLMDGEHVVWRKRTARVLGIILILSGLIGIIIIKTRFGEFASTLPFFAMMVLFGAMANSLESRNWGGRLHAVTAGFFAALAIVAGFLVLPSVDTFKGASDFCKPLRQLSEKNQTYRLYSLGFSREEYIFYSKHPHTPVLTDLLPVKLSHDISFAKMAKGQISLRKAIAKAVEKVPVASPAAPTDAEIAALHDAIHNAVTKTKVAPELAEAFEQSLIDTVGKTAREFDEPVPAFMFVQEEDWKWLLPVFPNLAKHKLIGHEIIGRRNMLLIANNAGAPLVLSD